MISADTRDQLEICWLQFRPGFYGACPSTMRRGPFTPTSQTKGHDDFWNCALCCRRHHGAFRRNFHLHTDPGVGRRRADLVRRRATHPLVRHRCARGGWHLSAQPPLSAGIGRGGSPCLGAAGWQTDWRITRRTYSGFWSGHDLQVTRQRWGSSHGSLVHFTQVRRFVLRNGQGWLGSAMGSVLAASSLLGATRRQAALHMSSHA